MHYVRALSACCVALGACSAAAVAPTWLGQAVVASWGSTTHPVGFVPACGRTVREDARVAAVAVAVREAVARELVAPVGFRGLLGVRLLFRHCGRLFLLHFGPARWRPGPGPGMTTRNAIARRVDCRSRRNLESSVLVV